MPEGLLEVDEINRTAIPSFTGVTALHIFRWMQKTKAVSVHALEIRS